MLSFSLILPVLVSLCAFGAILYGLIWVINSFWDIKDRESSETPLHVFLYFLIAFGIVTMFVAGEGLFHLLENIFSWSR
jgi:hypothetical protein